MGQNDETLVPHLVMVAPSMLLFSFQTTFIKSIIDPATENVNIAEEKEMFLPKVISRMSP